MMDRRWMAWRDAVGGRSSRGHGLRRAVSPSASVAGRVGMSLFPILLIAVVGSADVAQTVFAVDDRGLTIVLDQPAERVVVLGAFYAQILYDLDAVGSVVGLGEAVGNPDALSEIPTVGPAHAPSLELIVALEPDLVLGANDWNGDRAALERVDIPVYLAPWLTGIESVFDAVHAVGRLIGFSDAADRLAASMADELLEATSRAQGNGLRAAYVYAADADNLFAMGRSTPEHDLLVYAQIENVFGSLQGYTQVSTEALVDLAPDLLITDPAQVHLFREHPVLSLLPAVRQGRIVLIPASYPASTQVIAALQLLIEGVYGG